MSPARAPLVPRPPRTPEPPGAARPPSGHPLGAASVSCWDGCQDTDPGGKLGCSERVLPVGWVSAAGFVTCDTRMNPWAGFPKLVCTQSLAPELRRLPLPEQARPPAGAVAAPEVLVASTPDACPALCPGASFLVGEVFLLRACGPDLQASHLGGVEGGGSPQGPTRCHGLPWGSLGVGAMDGQAPGRWNGGAGPGARVPSSGPSVSREPGRSGPTR